MTPVAAGLSIPNLKKPRFGSAVPGTEEAYEEVVGAPPRSERGLVGVVEWRAPFVLTAARRGRRRRGQPWAPSRSQTHL